jgi:hypothetical protein
MDRFKVQHVIISLKEDGTPKLMSLHMPIDGKIRIHTLFPQHDMYKVILGNLLQGKPIILEAQLVQLETPICYALVTATGFEDLNLGFTNITNEFEKHEEKRGIHIKK